MSRRRLDGGWQVPPSAFAIEEQDRLRGRVRILNRGLEGGTETCTLPLQQWDLVRAVVVDVVVDQDPVQGALPEVVPGSSPQRVCRRGGVQARMS